MKTGIKNIEKETIVNNFQKTEQNYMKSIIEYNFGKKEEENCQSVYLLAYHGDN